MSRSSALHDRHDPFGKRNTPVGGEDQTSPDNPPTSNFAADIECAIGLHAGGGGVDGVCAARDAVLAVRDQEVERLRARLGRVQAIACRLASQGRLGVDLEADSIRRGIAQQLSARPRRFG
ncbi:hypothetical protein [Streptomyces microflavus]|uniref:hypothetical protein n=1 Tax=Streptomyces microflavus TaxID=1919 RepID=UPI0036E42877